MYEQQQLLFENVVHSSNRSDLTVEVTGRNTVNRDGSYAYPLHQDELDITDKKRSNLFSWRGQFSPQLVEAILKAYAPKEGLVVDPFVGSGTVLAEAGRLRLDVFGAEINPAAVKLAQIYCFINWAPDKRMALLRRLDAVISRCLLDSLKRSNTAAEGKGVLDLSSTLLRLYGELIEPEERTVVETLLVVVDFHQAPISPNRIATKWNELRNVIIGLPFSERAIQLRLCDARALPIADSIVDLVVTSPPYINVFNYHQQYRASVEALGWRPLVAARSEIGSNRKHRQNRFLTIVQYCLDMSEVLRELRRVCKPGSHIVMIVGRESNVRKTPFYNGKIIENLAKRCVGLEGLVLQERVFKNKFGQMIYEDVMTFGVPATHTSLELESPRGVAKEAISAAKERAPEESIEDLIAAIEAVQLVKPSPLFNAESVAP